MPLEERNERPQGEVACLGVALLLFLLGVAFNFNWTTDLGTEYGVGLYVLQGMKQLGIKIPVAPEFAAFLSLVFFIPAIFLSNKVRKRRGGKMSQVLFFLSLIVSVVIVVLLIAILLAQMIHFS